MTNNKIQFVGSPCGHHGNYTFYKAFRYTLHGKQRILALGEFFFLKIWPDEDIISVGEAQLLWEDKASGQILVSLRLYFLPENTPDGRLEEHGQHEVIALSEKVVLRAEDVVDVMRAASGLKWDIGLKGVYGPPPQDNLKFQESSHYVSPLSASLDTREVAREKKLIGDIIEPNALHVVVLNYDRYCRIRGLLKRLEGMEEELMKSKVAVALGGFLVPSRRTLLLFCRDIFDYPDLETHDLLCNHMAPKFSGRPRKKRRRRPDSESESTDGSDESVVPLVKGKPGLTTKPPVKLERKGSNTLLPPRNFKTILNTSVKNEFSVPTLNRLLEVDFMSKLHKFMRERNTPITRLPHIGYRQLNVFELFTRVQQFGGHEVVSQKKLWKHLYDEMAGTSCSTGTSCEGDQAVQNALTIRRHYERLLLPYERHLLLEQKRKYGIGIPSSRKREIKSERGGEPSVSILQKSYSEKKSKRNAGSFNISKMAEPSISRAGYSVTVGHCSSSTGDGGSSLVYSTVPLGGSSVEYNKMVPKVEQKKDHRVDFMDDLAIHADLAKRPEITITPIPRSTSVTSGVNQGKELHLADLMKFDSQFRDSYGSSALQSLAKVAERYEKPHSEPALKKLKTGDGASTRVNGTSQLNSGLSIEIKGGTKGSGGGRNALQVPDLVSPDFLHQILVPAHQNSKTLNALAALLPQTTIFPAPVPEAHQHTKSPQKIPQVDGNRPELPRGFQAQSVYTQSKHVYGNPVVNVNKGRDKRSSPDIEILDLSQPNNSRSARPPKNDRLEIELLDLSSRKDITVSAIPKQSSRNSTKGTVSSSSLYSYGSASDAPQANPSPEPSSSSPNAVNSSAAALLAAAQNVASMPNLGLNSHAFLPYLLSQGIGHPGTPTSSTSPLPSSFPCLDPGTLAYYNSLLSASTSTASSTSSTSQVSAATQLAQLNNLALSSISSLTPEALSYLGNLNSLLPQGSLPAPHFLSGLMSPASSTPPTSK